MYTLKYIVSEEDEIIIFNKNLSHRFFKKFNPIRAGFIDIDIDSCTCVCYGQDFSLGLKSNPEQDTTRCRLMLKM